VSNARPARRLIFGLISGPRPSSAYGYSQALDGTWNDYLSENKKQFASRTDFSDSVDFIGWYVDRAHKFANISKDDFYSLYLAYHEGLNGFIDKTYRNKNW